MSRQHVQCLVGCLQKALFDQHPDRGIAAFGILAQIAPAVRHLKVTAEGRRWLAQLHANVFRAEHKEDLNEHDM